MWPANFRLGMWAWVFQRITGAGIVFYLVLHIVVISSSLQGEGTFDRLLRFLESGPFLYLELVLIAAIIYHAVNGVRVILFDLGVGIRSQKPIFWGGLGVGAGLFGATLWAFAPVLL